MWYSGTALRGHWGLGTRPLPCLPRVPVTAWAASAVRGLGLDGG